jgi:hypothetical protein
LAKAPKRDPAWVQAKKFCRLNQEDIRMAKELGLKPQTLIKNIPSKSQQWKAPVKLWIRDLYEKKMRGTKAVAPPILNFASLPNKRLRQRQARHSLPRQFPEEPTESFEEERWRRILANPPEWIADDYSDEGNLPG